MDWQRPILELYPLFLNLRHKNCLVVGGGKVATRKISTLLQSGLRMTVISPDVSNEIFSWSENGLLTWIQKNYEGADIHPYPFIIAATNIQKINEEVAKEAHTQGKFVNVVDNPSLCNWVMPAKVEVGPIQVAISTSGTSPSLAKSLREKLEIDLSNYTNEFISELQLQKSKYL